MDSTNASPPAGEITAGESNQSVVAAAPIPAIEYCRLLHILGQGGGGRVFLAHDTLLDRPVAIKLLAHHTASDAERAAMLQEARAIASLQHPNIVTVYQVGQAEGQPYLMTEFLPGQDLRRIAKPLPTEALSRIALGLCRGLAVAHRKGILHRDIKPSNAMLTSDGEVKLIDFGLARHAATAAGDPGQPAVGTAPMPGLIRKDGCDTPVGLPVGTPQYMAPEVQQGEAATYRSDVYSLGLLLHELATGQLPEAGLVSSTALGPALAPLIARCLAAAPASRFASAVELLCALEHAFAPLVSPIPGEPGPRPSLPADSNPYRGLLCFEPEHHDLFFGRETETRELIERLRSDPLVVVAGDSGVGKSSLCRAGVLPRVAAGALHDGYPWTARVLVPGRQPLDALGHTVAALLGDSDPQTCTQALRDQPATLWRTLHANLGARGALILMIDQLEEAAWVPDPDRDALGRALGALVANAGGRLRLLMTVRGDFLTRIALLPELGDALGRTLYLLRPLSPLGLREAILEPARRAGFDFESTPLIDTLVQAGQAPGGLPVLAFALRALWERRDPLSHVIPHAALTAIGGVAAGLGRHGDAILASLSPGQEKAARRLLLALTSADRSRMPRTRTELGPPDPALDSALDALVRGRLLVASGSGSETLYTLVHDALLTQWDTLRAWLDADQGLRPLRQRLGHAVSEWQRLGHAADALWGPRQLQEARVLVAQDLDPPSRAFLRAAERAIRQRRRRGWFAASILLLAATLASMLVVQWSQVKQRQARATSMTQAQAHRQRAQATAQNAAALRTQALALFDQRGDAALYQRAEMLWTQAQTQAQAADRAHQDAQAALLGPLGLTPGDPDLRGHYSEILLDRILLAEAWAWKRAADELHAELGAYDLQHAFTPRLTAQAELTLVVTPADAEVVLLRDVDIGQRMQLQPVGRWRAGALPVLKLPAGSYLLRADAPGHPQTRLPVLLERGQPYTIHLALPAAGLPPGFIYIPPGRFRFGANGSDALRTYFGTQPEHPIESSGYLIGQTEVTVGAWIAYLKTLPARKQSLSSGFKDDVHVALQPLPDGRWQYRLKVLQMDQRVRSGQPFIYPQRTRNATQNWLRFPMTGISLPEARAYAQWLDRSGQLPGARLCSEHQWERAARGADGRDFPHGNVLLPDDANFDETYDRTGLGPDEVGTHPASASPFGVHDLAGNAWEWVESTAAPDQAVIRGGCFWEKAHISRSVNREVTAPHVRDALVGMRICASWPPDPRPAPPHDHHR